MEKGGAGRLASTTRNAIKPILNEYRLQFSIIIIAKDIIMKTSRFISRLACALLTTVSAAHAAENPAPVTTVASVDLQRYLGLWHEAARLPMWFQRNCVADTTAQYGLLEDGKNSGKISVTNRCRTKDGSFDQAQGKASVVENSGNARLKVSFFWPFSGDYWVIGLDPEYRWAVVGEPKRKSLWILSRTNPMPASELAAAKQIALAQGYDLTTLLVNDAANVAKDKAQ